jgi:phosphinothricin acetyltransferase
MHELNSFEEVLIRPCEDKDICAIAEIYAHHVLTGTASFETEPASENEMRLRRERLQEGGFPYLVATNKNEVVGFAYAGPYRPRAAYRSTVENSIYLRPEWSGRGIGRRLLEALLEECERRGFRQMVAVIGGSANIASIRLHEKLGFRLVGTLQAVGFKNGKWLDTVLLQRSLGKGGMALPEL